MNNLEGLQRGKSGSAQENQQHESNEGKEEVFYDARKDGEEEVFYQPEESSPFAA